MGDTFSPEDKMAQSIVASIPADDLASECVRGLLRKAVALHIRAAVAAEREACARLCDLRAEAHGKDCRASLTSPHPEAAAWGRVARATRRTAEQCAAAIRARSSQSEGGESR